MESSYKTLSEYTEKARDFVNRTLETPEVSAGIASLSDGAYGLVNASGNVLYGIFRIVRGTVIATRSNNHINEEYNVQTVRQNPVTGNWEIITEHEI